MTGNATAITTNSCAMNGTSANENQIAAAKIVGETQTSQEADVTTDSEGLTKKIEKNFGCPIEEMYRLSVHFYRANDGKAFHLSYDDRNKLVAYAKQITHGKYSEAKNQSGEDAVEAGFFDLIGNDRMQAWEALGDVSKAEAMAGFVTLLDAVCPQFRLYMEAQKRDMEEKRQAEAAEQERSRLESVQRQRRVEEEAHLRTEEQRRQIQEALNRQTYPQFRAYAEQQFPNSPEQQFALVRQLQEQHYQQYMAQVYSQQMMQNQQQQPPKVDAENNDSKNATNSAEKDLSNRHFEHGDLLGKAADVPAETNVQTTGSDADDSESGGEDDHADDLPSNPAIGAASMWTRKDIKEFKEAIRKEGSEGVIKVGHGETVTVRVPTHDEGTCLFWEFATDYYDIGFGVHFEWTISETNTVSVHISESDEEDEEDLENEKGDLEKGGKTDKDLGKPQQDEIIPVYRRDCHEEVYAGSHVYPGKGVYLLKFDNSYSLWRSKTLYYRVYYGK